MCMGVGNINVVCNSSIFLYRKFKFIFSELGTVKYEILVTTSDISGAGTDANVFVTLYGSDGQDSGKRALTGSTFRNLFERKQLDTFQIEAVDLGESAYQGLD